MDEPKRRRGIKPHSSQADIVRQIADMYLRGKSLGGIANWLMDNGISAPKGGHVWHASTIDSVLRSPVHAGLLANDDGFIKGAHYDQLIYDPEVYYQILEQMKSRSRMPSATLGCPEALLAQVALCDECGSRLRVAPINKQYRAYYCGGQRLHGTRCESRPYVRGDLVESRLVREIEKVATDPELLALAAEEAAKLAKESSSAHDGESQKLRSELSDIERQWVDLGQALANGCVSPDMVSACDRSLQSRKRAIDVRLKQIESASHAQTTAAVTKRALDALRDFPRLWDAMEPEERRAVVGLVVESMRIGRVDHAIRVKVKVRLLGEIVFDLPVTQNSSRGRGNVQPAISLRQLAYLALTEDGYTDEQIAAQWDVSIGSTRDIRERALERLGASDPAEAVEKMRRELAEWRGILPLEGRFRKLNTSFSVLDIDETRVLKGMALGKTDKQLASGLAVPVTTMAGWRQRVREKLQSTTTQAAVAKAVSLGLLRSDDPSPVTLLRAYRKLASPVNAGRLAELGIVPPTNRQIECLRALADGLNVDQAARRMGIEAHSASVLRHRIWQVVGASNCAQALERVTEIGVLRWPAEDEETAG